MFSMDRWSGKIALVTGASDGIGAVVAHKLVEHGMQVVGCGRNMDRLNKVTDKANSIEKGKMFAYQCDLSEENQMLDMFKYIKETFGTIHVCVNNAAIIYDTSILEGKTSEWMTMFQVNVIGLLVCTRESVKLMRATGVDDGHIINMNSVAGHRIIHKPLYGATKFAVTALNRGLRLELIEAGSRIRSTQISPGFVETYILDKVYPGQGKCDKLFAKMNCLKSEDIADSVLYILALPPHANVDDIIIRPTEQAE